MVRSGDRRLPRLKLVNYVLLALEEHVGKRGVNYLGWGLFIKDFNHEVFIVRGVRVFGFASIFFLSFFNVI